MADCGCGSKTRILYACSGAADVGKAADETARKLSKDGFGRLTCLAGIGAHLSGFVETAKAADENITIDGCGVACAKKALEHIDVAPRSYILTEMGLVKGKTDVCPEVIDTAARKILEAAGPSKSASSKNSGCCGSKATA